MSYGLLNSLASDLDFMLQDLCCSAPPSLVGNGHSDTSVDPSGIFLEAYLQGLASTTSETDSETTALDGMNKRLKDVERCVLDELEIPSKTQHILSAIDTISIQYTDDETDGDRILTQDSTSTAIPPSSASSSEDDIKDNDEEEISCEILILERLIRTHPIWFLPGIQRAGAVHLLQGKEEGNFIVRQSSQSQTMAISVRLPPDRGPYIQHYLLQSIKGQMCLESSENLFDNIPSLIAHYCQCCDELPVQLLLPTMIREAKTSQQLASVALLGQEFWGCPMASSYSPSPGSSNKSILSLNSTPVSESLLSNVSPPPLPPRTPDGSPQDIQSPSNNSLSTFKPTEQELANVIRPTPPNSLNLGVAPPPPPRWAKPPSSITNQNFTLTTTLTLSFNQLNDGVTPVTSSESPNVEVSCIQITSPNNNNPSLTTQFITNKLVPRRLKNNKESHHYRESDLLDSPPTYYHSSVADKASDYEDIWGQSPRVTPERTEFTTFRPISGEEGSKINKLQNKPDLLEKISSISVSVDDIPNNNNKVPPLIPSSKNSPFYAEPADAIGLVSRRERAFQTSQNNPFQRFACHRHSDPNIRWNHGSYITSQGLPRIDSNEELPLSSSVDNLSMFRSNKGKCIKMPKVYPLEQIDTKEQQGGSWTVDSSWEFIGNEDETCQQNIGSLSKFPTIESNSELLGSNTVADLLALKLPGLKLCESTGDRHSAYDNLEGVLKSDDDDTRTEFCEPWDSSRWENLLKVASEVGNSVERNEASSLESLLHATEDNGETLERKGSFHQRMDPLLSPQRLQSFRSRESWHTGASIRAYTLHLAEDKSTTFAQNIENFIACTREGRNISSPQAALRNIRQFMSGMKNYLVKHGEREFDAMVEKERSKLKSTEFLNLDSILEGVMYRLVVRPLKEHIYHLFVEEYTHTGSIQDLAESIHWAKGKEPQEFGLKPEFCPPPPTAMEAIRSLLSKMQEAYSPLDKLENLLAAISTIFNNVEQRGGIEAGMGADDFLPIFAWVLAQSNLVSAEIESELMWGLLHPALLAGEGAYYLTALSSAVHLLKGLKDGNNSTQQLESAPGCGVLRVVIPDETQGSLLSKTLPLRPHMTTRDISRIVAHKLRVTNPQDYALFKLVDGEETLLGDNEDPQTVREAESERGKCCIFAYKRLDAKIAWPKNA